MREFPLPIWVAASAAPGIREIQALRKTIDAGVYDGLELDKIYFGYIKYILIWFHMRAIVPAFWDFPVRL